MDHDHFRCAVTGCAHRAREHGKVLHLRILCSTFAIVGKSFVLVLGIIQPCKHGSSSGRSCQSKITDLCHSVSQQHVSAFEISMPDPTRVQELYSFEHLLEDDLGFLRFDHGPQRVQVPVGVVVGDEVHVERFGDQLSVYHGELPTRSWFCEDIPQFDDVWMVREPPQDAHFTQHPFCVEHAGEYVGDAFHGHQCFVTSIFGQAHLPVRSGSHQPYQLVSRSHAPHAVSHAVRPFLLSQATHAAFACRTCGHACPHQGARPPFPLTPSRTSSLSLSVSTGLHRSPAQGKAPTTPGLFRGGDRSVVPIQRERGGRSNPRDEPRPITNPERDGRTHLSQAQAGGGAATPLLDDACTRRLRRCAYRSSREDRRRAYALRGSRSSGRT
mmetsp:Transcript_3798/g.23982  ORF Transcript_3798/g.23982 Transcript_3798/m.23982 type:complete len:384 (+) Transcript_3798:1079-2230(+)